MVKIIQIRYRERGSGHKALPMAPSKPTLKIYNDILCFINKYSLFQ